MKTLRATIGGFTGGRLSGRCRNSLQIGPPSRVATNKAGPMVEIQRPVENVGLLQSVEK